MHDRTRRRTVAVTEAARDRLRQLASRSGLKSYVIVEGLIQRCDDAMLHEIVAANLATAKGTADENGA